VTDAAVRTHVTDDIAEPALPYADAPLDGAPN
jgi:hypothetical protein